MSKVKKYLGMISILLAFNLITFFISFLFFEYSETANMIINYSSIVCFFVLCFLLSFYIAKKFEKSLLPLSVLYVLLAFIRLIMVAFQESVINNIFMMLGWSSFWPIEYILSEILSIGPYFMDYWTVPVYPIIQVLFCAIFTLIIRKCIKAKAVK